MDDVTIADATGQPDRRSVLKKAGVVGLGIWAAPVVTSISSPAYATGSPPTGAGCIVLESAANVSITWAANACNTLTFGLVGGAQACTNCSNNSAGSGSHDFGNFPAGAALNFYFDDNGFGSCCNGNLNCNGHYECSSGTTHIGVQKISDTQYRLYFADAGCDFNGDSVCDRVAQDSPPQAGPGAANMTVDVFITPVAP